ncbi:hypothetical protein Tco_1036469 [Tanacetum coccineum]
MSSNTRNQVVIHDGRVDIQSKNVGYGGNGNRNAGRQSKNQEANAGNGLVQQIDESDQIVQRVLRTESNPGRANIQEQMLLAMKDEAGGNLNDEENDFMLDNAYIDETLKELTVAVIMMACIQPTNDKVETKPKYDAKAISDVNASQINLIEWHDIQRLGYQNPEYLKKAIAVQPKMYDGERLHNTKLIIDSPDFKETLEDVKEGRLKMRNKMIQLDYEKLNALYDTFVPQKEPSAEQTYFQLLLHLL